MEKHFVFDKDQKLVEVRGYKDDIVVERYEIVYDENDAVVGLRPLKPEEVVPEGWLDCFKRLWRKPKPLTQILSIDFIGLIQYINTINKIKTIENIELIDKITLIDDITKIGEISTIRDLTHRPPELIVNSFFEEDFIGWQKYGSPSIDETISKYGSKSVKFPRDIVSWIRQVFPIPLSVDWFTKIMCWVRTSDAAANAFYVTYYYTDDSFSYETLATTAGDAFQRKTLSPTSGKYLEVIQFEHLTGYTRDSWLDAILTVF